jgi:hypothetical protein
VLDFRVLNSQKDPDLPAVSTEIAIDNESRCQKANPDNLGQNQKSKSPMRGMRNIRDIIAFNEKSQMIQEGSETKRPMERRTK